MQLLGHVRSGRVACIVEGKPLQACTVALYHLRVIV